MGQSIACDPSGNILVTGSFAGTNTLGSTALISAGLSDMFLAKYDSAGNLLWARRAGGASYDEGRGVATDGAGNAYVTGLFQGVASFGNSNLTSSGQSDVFVAKYDPAGTLAWVQRAGGNDFDESHAIVLDAATNIYLTGYFDANATFGGILLRNNSGSSDVFVAKTDSRGVFLWARQAGGNGEDIGAAVVSDGTNIYVTGCFETSATFGSTNLTSNGTTGAKDVFLAAYDATGTLRWVQQAGGAGDDCGHALALDSSGTIYMTGEFLSPAAFGTTNLVGSGKDIFLAKYGPTGNLGWVRKAGGNNNIYGDSGQGVQVDRAGSVYVAGYFSGTASFGVTNLASSGFDDLFVAKYDTSGQAQWVRKAGGGNLDVAYALALDAATNIYLTGFFYGTAAFGWTNLTSSGFEDLFVLKLGTMDPPYLTAVRSGNTLVLSWPDWASQFTLQYRDVLPAFDGWSNVPTSTNRVAVPLSESQRFYRLIRP